MPSSAYSATPSRTAASKPAAHPEHGHVALRPMDLLIVGVGRAGTTLLANLLTTPPQSLILIEPGITRGGVDAPLREQFRRAGLQLPESAFDPTREPDSLKRFEAILPSMSIFRRWGAKEVNPTGLDRLIESFKPARYLLAVRNLHHVAASGLRKLNAAKRPDQTQDWLLERLGSGADAVLQLAHTLPSSLFRVVRYEELVASDTERTSIANWLNWPLDGDPSRCLDLFGRESEVAKHAGQITTRSVSQSEQALSAQEQAFARRLIARATNFQQHFGYGD